MMRVATVTLVLAVAVMAPAQVTAPEVDAEEAPTPPRLPTTEEMLGLEPLLATSLSDARTGVPFLDDFDPKGGARMTLLPRGPNGGFLLVRSGVYELDFQSYCLQAGTYGPGEGDGFLYAPLKGPQADIVRSVLLRSAGRPELSQDDVQSLLWDILAGLSARQFEGPAGRELLTAEERATLGDLADERYRRAQARMPEIQERMQELVGGELGRRMEELSQRLAEFGPRMQQAVAAGDMAAVQRYALAMQPLTEEMADLQTQWLQELGGVGQSFEEREQGAVLQGEHEPGPGSREVPGGRWSYHPDGYYLRFFSSSYRRTRAQLYVARKFDIERDGRGRIASIADRFGNRIETDYDDTVPPATVAGDPGVQGHAFRAIRFVRRVVFAPEMMFEREAEWEGAGWTLVGVPSGEGRPGEGTGRYPDLSARYEAAKTHREQLGLLEQGLGRLREELGKPRAGLFRVDGAEPTLRDVMDVAHYALALREALRGRADRADWTAAHLALAKQAWAFALCRHTGGWVPGDAGARVGAEIGGLPRVGVRLAARAPAPWGLVSPGFGQAAPGAPEYVPSDAAAVPGDTADQRLGLGGADPESDKKHDINAMKYELEVAKAVRKAFDEVQPEPGEDVDAYRKRVAERASNELRKSLQEKGIRETPGKPLAPMGTDPTDLRIAPGGERGDPDYADDWAAYDKMGEQEFEQHIKNEYFSDDPDGVWEACREHEQDHIDLGKEEVERARARGDENWREAFREWLENPWLLRDAERRAYDRQIKYLEDWIAHDC